MKQFVSVKDVDNPKELVKKALEIKQNPKSHRLLGDGKTLGLIFMNPSFRTRLSTQRAAQNLGMSVISLNINQEGWRLEMEDGTVMNGSGVEHIKDAATIMGIYCDIIGIRCFAGLESREEDYAESILNKFIQYCGKPVISLESATLHPLQSLADMITIEEHKGTISKPKIVLTWAPHVKPLPQAVANSFAEWVQKMDVDFAICNPPGYDLSTEFTNGAKVVHDQELALKDATFVYTKNWSSFEDYGSIAKVEEDWMLNPEKLKLTNKAKVMHCLPVRRNLEVPDSVLDGPDSLILKQAENRIYAAQIVLKTILESL